MLICQYLLTSLHVCFSEVYFKSMSDRPFAPIRDVKAAHIGKLVKVKGIVTRATEVKPMMIVATYTCDQCGSETYQPVSTLTYSHVMSQSSQALLLSSYLPHSDTASAIPLMYLLFEGMIKRV